MVGAGFSPLGEEGRKKGMNDFFVIPLAIPAELPKFVTNLDEYGDFGRKGAKYWSS